MRREKGEKARSIEDLREVFTAADQHSIELMLKMILIINALLSIFLTRYPNGRTNFPKSGNMHLILRRILPTMTDLSTSPLVFDTILTLIQKGAFGKMYHYITKVIWPFRFRHI